MRAIDLFAGAGGFTAGAELAGARVVWAANHNPTAVEVHRANHPSAEHACQDLRQANFTRLPAFDVLLASPACQGHSSAGQPGRRKSKRAAVKHDADRSTAWAIVDCAEACLPRHLVVENVVNFRAWQLFPIWRAALEALGYRLTEHVLDAADFGVPQHRRRLFVTGTRGRRPITLPMRPRRAHVAGATVLEADDADRWAPLASKPAGVQARAARARAHGHGRRFFLQHTSDHKGRDLRRPLGTITTVASHWHLVDGDQIRPLSVRELARAQGFGDDFELPDAITIGTRLVGNAVPPPLAAAVVRAVLAS